MTSYITLSDKGLLMDICFTIQPMFLTSELVLAERHIHLLVIRDNKF